MDSTSDSILAYKLTKDTVTLHNKVFNVCALIAGQIVSEVGYLAHEQMLACIGERRYNGLGDIMDIPLMLSFHMLFILC